MTLDDSTKIYKEQSIWVFFDYLYYDYYVGEAQLLLPDETDEDGAPVYYIACQVFVGEDLDSSIGDTCTARRHRIEVTFNADIDENEVLTIKLYNMYNPQPDSVTLSYNVIVMNYTAEGEDEDLKDKGVY